MATTLEIPQASTGVQTILLALDRLTPSLTNPRKHFDDAEIKNLAASIEQQGLIEPIVVRPWLTTLADKAKGLTTYEIVCGERRYRAMQLLGKRSADCVVREFTDAEVLDIQVTENLQREDLTPLDWAQAFKALVDQEKKKQGAGTGAATAAISVVATRLGKSTSVVYQTMQLAKLIPAAADAMRAGKLSKNHGIDCARLGEAEQKEYLKECLRDSDDPASVKDMREWIDEEIYRDVKVAPFPSDDATLYPPAGACGPCPKLAGNNLVLFPDLSKRKTTCTDGTCFERKMQAFVARVKHQAAADNPGKKVAEVTDHYDGPKGALKLYNVARSKLGDCESTRPAVMVDGRERGTLLHTCDDEKCKKHHGSGYSRSSTRSAPDPSRVREEQKYNVECATRQEVARQALLHAVAAAKKQKVLFTDDDLRQLALYAFMRVPGDYQISLGKFLGWERTKEQKRSNYISDNFENTAEAEIPKLGRGRLAYLLLACSVASELKPNYSGDTNTAELGDLAKRYGVDVSKIRAKLKAEAGDKVKARAKKKAARK